MLKEFDAATLSIITTILGSIFLLGWRLSNQFRDVRALVYSQGEKIKEYILDKLNYHEKHDDERFDKIANDVWLLRLRNAAKDGVDIKPINGKKT